MRWSRIWIALGLLAAASLTAGSSPAQADSWYRDAPVVYVGVSQADVCQGTLMVTFRLEALHGHHWMPMLDDGNEFLQLHEVSGRSGPTGQWMTVKSSSGGEGRLRWTSYGQSMSYGGHYDLVRVVRPAQRTTPRVVSMGYPLTDECRFD